MLLLGGGKDNRHSSGVWWGRGGPSTPLHFFSLAADEWTDFHNATTFCTVGFSFIFCCCCALLLFLRS